MNPGRFLAAILTTYEKTQRMKRSEQHAKNKNDNKIMQNIVSMSWYHIIINNNNKKGDPQS